MLSLSACQSPQSETTKESEEMHTENSDFQWQTEQFADLRILRYQVPGWEKLSLQQKKLAYYLSQAGLEGRDILWDQQYRHNIEIRKAIETIIKNYNGVKDTNWENFLVYAKRVFFSNGIHHHYSHAKIVPDFNSDYLRSLLKDTEASLSDAAFEVIFNDEDAKGVSKDPNKDLLLASAVNFYDPDITAEEATAFYKAQVDPNDSKPISYGLNSKLVRENGELVEKTWHLNGMYGAAIEVKDLDASEKMAVISKNIQYFEDNSPILDQHKKEKVVGVSYRMINVVGEAGATTPSTPIGVNLPNANWIREAHGSKSISLTNIEGAYEEAKGAGFLEEFTFSAEEIERAKKYSALSGKMHTALHEVVGHASGKLEPGVATPNETLKNYSSTLEEARADLVALYFIMDQKMLELGLMESLEAGKAEYDNYIRNGLMLQLRRLKPGEIIEEDHMRNRQLVAAWAYEMGKENNVIEKKVLDGKTYFVINDYTALRDIFGQQLREIQRIKSQGDFQAGKDLVENYGVQVDQALHEEVLARTEKLNIAPYAGFIQPEMRPVYNGEEISDIEIHYPDDFLQQMLFYGERYSNL